jgi:ribose transport system permease protein
MTTIERAVADSALLVLGGDAAILCRLEKRQEGEWRWRRCSVFGIPGVVACWAFLGIVMWVILHRTIYGKQLFLIGANRTAAHLSGIKIGPMVVTTYALSGLLASLGGVVLLGYTGSVFINLGNEYVLPSVAAVAMGGTLLSGGVGGYTGTMLGAMVLTLVQSLLITVGFPESARQIVFGGVLIAVLSLYGRQRL